MNGLIAVVPARAGSKGVPGKNKAPIAGRPVIDYTLEAVRRASPVSSIVVTTDDAEIRDRYRGESDLFVVDRPAELAADDVTVGPAIEHALRVFEESGRVLPKNLLLAPPTTPLRSAADIEGAWALFEHVGRSVISACRADGVRHPRAMYAVGDDGRGSPIMPARPETGQRQAHEAIYQRNGAIYILPVAEFRRTGRVFDAAPFIYSMPWERSINIDTHADLLIARALIESGVLAGLVPGDAGP